LQADAHLTQILKRHETVSIGTKEHRESLAELAPRIKKLHAKMATLDAQKKKIAANPDTLDYQSLRRAMHSIMDEMSVAGSALSSDKAEFERIDAAVKDSETFSARFDESAAKAEDAVAQADKGVELASKDFDRIKTAYSKLRLKYYDIVSKKKKRK
jgi:phage shock protein A